MPKMIRVRSTITGQVTEVNELAYGAFAANYERLDTAAAGQQDEPAPTAEAATPAKSKRRGTAQDEKE